jgi:cyclic 2,3-diphosphoglycerate synthetase
MIDLLKNIKYKGKKLIALIDGEHYPEVTYDALMLLKNRFIGNFSGIVFLGGLEKLITSNLSDYYSEKVYKIGDIDSDFVKALEFFNPDIVYDLSDEPVVNYVIRMKIASFCLAKECSYMGPDFLFEYEEKNITTDIPTIAVIGTGKRVGKTECLCGSYRQRRAKRAESYSWRQSRNNAEVFIGSQSKRFPRKF